MSAEREIPIAAATQLAAAIGASYASARYRCNTTQSPPPNTLTGRGGVAGDTDWLSQRLVDGMRFAKQMLP